MTSISHQNARTRFRPTDSTLIMDLSIQHVAGGRGRSLIKRQTKQAPVKGGDNQSLSQNTLTVDSRGVEVKNIDGMIAIESSFPITIMIGGAALPCTGIFAMTGSIDSLIIVAAQPTVVSITAVVRNL
jgi:hypothetical protein